MSPLSTRQDERLLLWSRWEGRSKPHLDALMAQELYAGAPMFSAAPIPKDAAVRCPLEGDGAGRSPGGVLSSLCPATATARAADRRDNRQCWPRRAAADCHQLRFAARSGGAPCPLDNAGCRLAGGERPLPQSDLLSEAGVGGRL